ncbi:MAG: hypothetical protein H0S82_03705 [Anaerolineaceae bacterium]|nr:hypothetical protein [Anaerolineaceae bacterium]
MFVGFKKRIMVDTSSEEARRATNLLDEHKIKYELRTKRPRGSVGTALDAQSYARGNISMYKGASQPIFIYMVYVKRKDYDQAMKLLYSK